MDLGGLVFLEGFHGLGLVGMRAALFIDAGLGMMPLQRIPKDWETWVVAALPETQDRHFVG